MRQLTWYKVQGINPQPWEAAEGNVGKKGGKIKLHFRSPEQLRAYKEAFAAEFVKQNPHHVQFEGDLEVFFAFWRQLDLAEEMEGRNHRAHHADTTNTQKATEDALQGILYTNDKSNRDVRSVFVAQGPEVNPFVLVAIGQYDTAITFHLEQIKEMLYVPEDEGTSNIRSIDISEVF